MKFLSLLLSAAPLASAATTACNADNCARAVTGTARGLPARSSARQDCSSFLRATVFPATVTRTTTTTIFPFTSTVTRVTSTVQQTSTVFPFTQTSFSTTTTFVQTASTTNTQTDTVIVSVTGTTTVTAAAKKVRTVAPVAAGTTVRPSSVPPYASPCAGTARYSSACSCFGVTQTTTTMPTPTRTVTRTVTGTATFVSSVAVTSVKTVSLTTTLISLVGTTSTSTLTETQTVPVSQTTSVQSTTTVIPQPTGAGACQNGAFADGLSAPCPSGNCNVFEFRIEGLTDTIWEGPILTGPRDITTPSGGTHLCDGRNGGANPVPAGTGTTAIDSAGRLCGFDYDGTYSSQFDDFFIRRIASSDTTSNQFWGILKNFQFTPAGGCQTEAARTDEILWAFDAFNKNFFLDVQPRTATVTLGSVAVFTVTDGQTGQAVAGASFNGLVSDANGQVVYVPSQPGTFRVKATRSDSIRSPAAVITVTA